MTLTDNDILVYFFKKYPNPNELSKARVVKMLYLSDWKSCIEYGQQITSIQWYFNHYGPYVEDIITNIRFDKQSRFEIKWEENTFGQPKEIIRLKDNVELPNNIPEKYIEILDFIIGLSYARYFNDFIDLVYSTYPVRTQPKYSYLDLPKLAKEYNKEIGKKAKSFA